MYIRPQVHNQFTTLMTRYSSLTHELSTPFMKTLLVHPFQLPPIDPDFIPRVLLRSKLIPELQPKIPAISINALDETAVKQALQHAKVQLEFHDDVVTEALRAFRNMKEEFDFKMRIKEGDEESFYEDKNANMDGAQNEDEEMDESDENGLIDQPQTEKIRTTDHDKQSEKKETDLLTEMITFVSCGKKKVIKT